GPGAAAPARVPADPEQRAGRAARRRGAARGAGGRGPPPRLSLARLDENGGAVGADGAGERGRVAVGDEADLDPERAERLAYRLFARQRERAHGAAAGAAGRGDGGPGGRG